MELRITTLSENSAGDRFGHLLAEWGLSILVETNEAKVLLDTGRSISAAYNADTLGIDLSQVDKMVLSHSHLDHTGGLMQVLRRMKKEIEIIAHPDVWAIKYNRREGQEDTFMGIPFQRQELENLGARFNLTKEPVEITANIITSGEVPMITPFENMASGKTQRLIMREGDLKPDEILDDQAIFVKTSQGLVIVTGCAHRGIINTVYHAQKLTGVKQVHTVVGGSHLVEANEERIWLTIAALKELDVQRLGLCHCTNLYVAALLANEFGKRFFFNTAGTTIEIPEKD